MQPRERRKQDNRPRSEVRERADVLSDGDDNLLKMNNKDEILETGCWKLADMVDLKNELKPTKTY